MVWEKIFEVIDESIFLTDSDFHILVTNSATASLLGIPKEKIIGETFYRLFHQSDKPVPNCSFKQMLKSKKSESLEFYAENLGRYLRVEVYPIFDKKGEIELAVHKVKDITAEKELENLLRLERDKLQKIQDNINFGISIIGQGMKILDMNRQMKEWFPKIDLASQPICYQSFNDPPRKKICSYCPTIKTFKDGKVYSAITKTPTGKTIRFFEVTTTPLKDERGNVVSVIELVQDITKRKEDEEKLHHYLEVERVISKISSEFIQLQEIDLGIKRALSYLGKLFDADLCYFFQFKEDSKQLHNTHLWTSHREKKEKKKIPPIKLENFPWLVSKLQRKENIVISDTKKLPLEAFWGKKMIKSLNVKAFLATPLYLNDKLYGFIGLATTKKVRSWTKEDIDCLRTVGEIIVSSISRRKVEKELRATLKALKIERNKIRELTKNIIKTRERERLMLAADIHDDLIQSLVATTYFLQSLDLSQLNQKTLSRRNRLIEILQSSIRQGRDLLTQLEPVRQPDFGLVEAIKKIVNLHFASSKIKFNFEFPQKIPSLNKEMEINLFRIIQEALINILKHSKASQVWIKFFTNKDKLKLEIRDDGIGFDKKVIRKAPGHYGLLAMEERASIIGGKITIESQSGKGTKIKLDIPIKV